MVETYKDIGTQESDSETNKAIRDSFSEKVKSSGIERKSIDKSTFLTAAAIVFGTSDKIGPETPHEELGRVLEKVAAIGYPVEQFEHMDKRERLSCLRSLHTKMYAQLGKY